MDGSVVQRTLCSEVFAERSPAEIGIRKSVAPECIMLRRVNVNGLINASVHRQIRLLVAVYVELPNRHTATHRRFEYRCSNDSSIPFHFARKPNIYGYEFHLTAV